MVHISDDVLNDVFSRFILPEAKTKHSNTDSHAIRLCFAIEMAHWFYLDTMRPADGSLPDCAVEVFAKRCFKYMPALLGNKQEAGTVLRRWREFKRRVPVYGAMLVSPDKRSVLLVEGNSTRGCWTFPRGKIEESEDPFDCACREVLEETNFDITSLADKSYYIEKVCSERRVRLYMVHEVPRETVFFPRNRGEISAYRWFNIEELPGAPGYRKKKEQFFMVNPFIREYLSKGYRSGKRRNNASECEAVRRDRGHSFTEGEMFGGRRDSFVEDRMIDIPPPRDWGHNDYPFIRHHPRGNDHELPRDTNALPRDTHALPGDDHLSQRYDEGYTSCREDYYYRREREYHQHVVNPEIGRAGAAGRGARGRKASRPTARGQDQGQNQVTLANFHFDMQALLNMLPALSSSRAR